MKSFNFFCILVFTIVLLEGCSTFKKTAFTPINTPLKSTKKTPITEKELKRWSHLDIVKDTIPGMSVDRAYTKLLKHKTNVKVIVGIVDSGVDIEHEDLKSVIWTNEKEIPYNGIDDDLNGYIDDIHGWNFMGDITKEHIEYERIVLDKNLVDEATYQAAKALNDKNKIKAELSKTRLEQLSSDVEKADAILTKTFGKNDYSDAQLKALDSQDPEIVKSKELMHYVFNFGMSLPEFKIALQEELDGYKSVISGDNLKTDYRQIVGDNPNDIADTHYGNNNVMGISPNKEQILHGTHVAGIVAQVRKNNVGGDGIANNVAILVVRAVPDGDEYDKDIALGIRYAVDNGAKIINGSFGKGFSPHKQWVYDAIKYAESKDVLIVHAAGNSAMNIDSEDNFPNDSEDKKTEFADNFITVGALNYEIGPNIVAKFSNYGKENVDVFAPGVKIYASTPNNTYKLLQGTSMASPNVAGVAALIRSYYPKLSAQQVKHILMDSGVAITTDVIVGGKAGDLRSFAALSKSGKIVNAYNALLMAEEMTKQ